MVKNCSFRWSAVLVACLTVALSWAVLPLAAQQVETDVISGEVEAAEHDPDGDVVEVSVFDLSWGSVLVLKDEGKGAELLKHVGAIISATGELRELEDDSGYVYAFKVISFAVEEPADPADP